MSAGLRIRPLTAADFDAWVPLWQAYLTFYDTALPLTISETTFARLTDEAARERGAFVAEMDGAPVGFVHYIFHAHNWHLADVCYLQDLYVQDNARGCGAGKALIEAVYKTADDEGASNVYWTTQESNTTARRLYDYIGEKTSFIKYQRPPTI